MSSLSYVVVLPTFGAPYIFGSFTKEDFKMLQKAVQGGAEQVRNDYFIIHPFFAKANPRWNLARQLLTSKKTKVYVNENGRNVCCPNMATIVRFNRGITDEPLPLFGDVCLVVPKSVFDVLCPNADALALHKDGDCEMWEFDDEAELDAFTLKAKTEGLDFNPNSGFCYKAMMKA